MNGVSRQVVQGLLCITLLYSAVAAATERGPLLGRHSPQCKSRLSEPSALVKFIQLARQEVGLPQSDIDTDSVPFTSFFRPGFGVELFLVNNTLVMYALNYKTSSEGIAEIIMRHDSYHKVHPEEPENAFLSRRDGGMPRLRNLSSVLFHRNLKSARVFTFVRDPLAHFISGLTEARFRYITNGVGHPALSDQLMSQLQSNSANVSDARRMIDHVLSMDWDKISKELNAINHYGLQSRSIVQWQAQFVGMLEHMPIHWAQLNVFLNTSMSYKYHNNHISSKDPMRVKASLLKLFKQDLRYLRAVCWLLMIDYICLKDLYKLPLGCSDSERMVII